MRTLVLVAALCAAVPAYAWDGTDLNTGGSVEVEKGNLVRTGRDIEIYDHESGEYRDVQVESMRSTGSGVEIEVYDYDSGEYRTFEMED
ncbi:DUF5334 family protein [Mesorhizobium marinum]|uniref:DUF5334 family protein n=1 Tax=Mesorhizobium marinum TaxID=3228790 RepID=UPI003466FFD1